MKNTFGNNLTVTLFGESHGEAIGAVLDGLAPGILINREFIEEKLSFRRPSGEISTARVEKDSFRIVSGAFEDRTTGAPLCIIIPNEDTRSKDYSQIKDIVRPGHADYTAFEKYNGFADYRGGGHFSGRITAPLVAAGAIVDLALREKGVKIGTHLLSCGDVRDRDFIDTEKDIDALNKTSFAVLDCEKGEEMKRLIAKVKQEGDSVGGILETAVTGLPVGLGDPWFDTVEGLLAKGLFSIPGIKGVQFGNAFDTVCSRGSEFNDPFVSINGRIMTKTNNNGGVNGGITNGMPVIFRCAVKPTPSIFKAQDTVNMKTGENVSLSLSGRHDPAIIHRVRAVVDAITAITVADMMQTKYGSDFLGSDRK